MGQFFLSTIIKTKGSIKKTKIGENGEEIEIDSDMEEEGNGNIDSGKKGKGKWGFKGVKTTLAGMKMILYLIYKV